MNSKAIWHKDMCAVLQPIEKGVAKLEKFRAEGFAAEIQKIPQGEYIRLYINGELMMSNTDMEKRTSILFLSSATGDILIAGLGIGLVIMPLLEYDDVKSITVLEKYQDVIDCVLPQLKSHDSKNKLTVICADCFDYLPVKKYDTIFLDIWPSINSDLRRRNEAA